MLLFEILVVAALIVLNGLLAMSELAIVSSRPARLRRMVEQSIAGSRRALVLASNPGRFLSTVQIGITLVGVLSGALSGATIGIRLGQQIAALGLSQAVADALGVGLIVAIITYASLIVGELVPKQIALRNPERVAVRVAPAMTLLSRIAAPLVSLLDTSGRAVLHLTGHREQPEKQVTEEELHTLMAEAEHAGVLEPGEKEMIHGLMRLGDRPVHAIMTPRHEVDMVNLAAGEDVIRAKIASTPHSRLPIYDTEPDEVLGVIQAKDLLNVYVRGQRPDIRDHIRSAPMIPDSLDARDVVAILKGSPVHIGIVVDEYGHFEGIVTSADVLEAIVGGFHTEMGPSEPAAVRRPDGSLLISGWMPIDEFEHLAGIPLPEDRAYHTVAGFILDGFRELPAVGASFDAHGWRFEVVDLDGRRIDKILATRLPGTRRPLSWINAPFRNS